MSDDFRIPTKNELREAIDKAHDAEVARLQADLAAVREERDRLKQIQTDEGRLKLIELLDDEIGRAVAERDAAVKLLNEVISFEGPEENDAAMDRSVYDEVMARAFAFVATHDAARAGRGEGDSPQPVEYRHKHNYEVISPNDLDK